MLCYWKSRLDLGVEITLVGNSGESKTDESAVPLHGFGLSEGNIERIEGDVCPARNRWNPLKKNCRVLILTLHSLKARVIYISFVRAIFWVGIIHSLPLLGVTAPPALSLGKCSSKTLWGSVGAANPSPLWNIQLLTRKERTKNVPIIVLTPGQITGPRNRHVIQDRQESFPGICKHEKKEGPFFLPLGGKLLECDPRMAGSHIPN